MVQRCIYLFVIVYVISNLQFVQCEGLEHGFNTTLLLNVFQDEFPMQDGARLASSESILVGQVLYLLNSLGVPLNASLVTEISEEKLLQVYMLAVTGNLMKGNSKTFRIDAISGKLVTADTYENNRQLIFEIMVFALLFVLGKTWFVQVK